LYTGGAAIGMSAAIAGAAMSAANAAFAKNSFFMTAPNPNLLDARHDNCLDKRKKKSIRF
jgi:formate hydrogenlyase subunit 3/multisubunit Na+/H+ antiporter MnhD subunit